jgi:hypothetical protein
VQDPPQSLHKEELYVVIASKEGNRVFKRFCLIALGIPSVLLVFTVIVYFSPWAADRAEISVAALNIWTACMAAAGLAAWAFFSFLLYRRLWKVFPYLGDPEKGWSYAEGVYGLLGVGTSMAAVLAMFFYLFSGDFNRSVILFAVSYFLAGVEAVRFPGRIADIEDIISEKH